MYKNIQNKFNNFFTLFPKITKDFTIYSIGGSIAHIITFITIPIITRILSPSEYGSVDVIYATVLFFSNFISLNVTSGFYRLFLEIPEDDLMERKKIASSMFWFIVCTGTLVNIIGFFISASISMKLFSHSAYTQAIRLGFASLPFYVLKDFLQGIFNLKRKPHTYIIFNTLYALLNFLLILFFVSFIKTGVTGYFLAHLITNITIAFSLAWKNRNLLGIHFSKKWINKMAAYGLPLLPGAFFLWGLGSVNRLLLTQFTTTTQIAYYSIAGKPARILEFAVYNFALSWRPVLLANLESSKLFSKLENIFGYYTNAGLLLAALVTVFAREFIRFLAPPDYYVAAGLVGAVCLRPVINHFGEITGIGIMKTKKSYLLSISMGAGVITTIGASVLLIPVYGIFGAIIADLIGETVNQVFLTFFSYRLLNVRWKFYPLLKTMVAYILLWYLTATVTVENYLYDLLLRLLWYLLFMVYTLLIVDRMVMVRAFFAFIKNRIQ